MMLAIVAHYVCMPANKKGVWLVRFVVVGVTRTAMANQQRRLLVLRDDRQLARFVIEGRATGKQLGTGSYGSVEEVKTETLELRTVVIIISISKIIYDGD